MVDVSSLKIIERSNVERPNLQEPLKWEMKILKLKRRNLFISKGEYETWKNSD